MLITCFWIANLKHNMGISSKNHRCRWLIPPKTIDGDGEKFSKTIAIPSLGKYDHHHSVATKSWPSLQSNHNNVNCEKYMMMRLMRKLYRTVCIGQTKIESMSGFWCKWGRYTYHCLYFSVWCIDAIYMEIAHTNVIALHHISCVFFLDAATANPSSDAIASL